MKTQNLSAKDVQKLLNKDDQRNKNEPIMHLKQFACYIEGKETICTTIHRFFRRYKGENMIEIIDLI
ncbi:hypothetical protein PCANB_003077 [Pneumocystis canis]|nr:hypothetical protein PCK1_003062 [Pneumocystis canis]KAG5438226.1 hypothetical protein PCANB_003077 [Pneumocystis canis]